MRFWKRSRKLNLSADDLKKAEMLEAYTRWLKNERLSRKQKRLLKDVNSLTELQPLKQLIDFAPRIITLVESFLSTQRNQ